MDFLSLHFGALCLAALLSFHAVRDARWRQSVLGLASSVYLLSFARRPEELSALGLFLAAGYALVLLARRRPSGLVFGLGVAGQLALFAWLKRYSALGTLPQPSSLWLTVGLSYVLFRVLQLAVDAFQASPGQTAQVSLWSYLLFTCSFLTFVSGPIQRFDDHRAQLATLGDFTLDLGTAYAGASRMANGYLKVALVSGVLLKLHGWLLTQAAAPEWAVFGAASLVYLLFLYANFSGSIDVVMGLGALLGFALPENFDRPFGAGNLIEFWNRWHITLSQWFKFYVFNPLLKLAGRWLKTPAQLVWAGVGGYFVTFLLMGVWHGTTWAFVLYGAVLGVGVAGTKLYESTLTKRRGKKGLAALRARPVYAAAANGLTIAYLAVALSLWWKAPGALFGAPQVLLGGVLFAAAVVVAAALLVRLAGRIPFALSVSKGQLLPQLWLGARAFVIACLAFDTSFHVPELLYRGF